MPLNDAQRAIFDDEYGSGPDLGVTLDLASRKNPQKHAEQLDLAEQAQVPINVVERLEPEIKRKHTLNGIDIDEIRAGNPALSKYLSDVDNATVSYDDIPALKKIEDAITAAKPPEVSTTTRVTDTIRAFLGTFESSIGRAFKGGGDLIEAINTSVSQAMPEDVEKWLTDPRDIPPWMDLSGVMRRSGEPFMRAGEIISPPPERTTTATEVAGGLGQLSEQAMVAILSGGISNIVSVWNLAAMGAEQQASALKKQGMTVRDDPIAVLQGAAVTGITEQWGLEKYLDKVPDVFKNKVANWIADKAVAGGKEAFQEIVEGIGHNLIEQYRYNPNAKIFEGVAREGEIAGYVGAIARTFISAVMPGRYRPVDKQVGDQLKNESLSGQEQLQLDEIIDLAQSSETSKRAAERFKAFLRDVPGDMEIHIAAEGLEQAPAWLQEMADMVGSDASMPIHQFLTDVVGNEDLLATLRPYIRLRPEGMTPQEMEQGDEIKDILARAERDEDVLTKAQEINDLMRQQLTDTERLRESDARYSVAAIESYMERAAIEHGVTIEQIYDDMRLSIMGPGGTTGLAEGEILEQVDLEALLKEFNDLIPEMELSKAQRDSVFDAPALERKQKLLEVTGLGKDAAWADERLDRVIAENQSIVGTDSRIAFVDPAAFVNSTHPDPQIIAEEAGELDIEKLRGESDTPFIWVNNDGGIVAHEGRHRMAALTAAGVNRVPIRVRHIEGTDFADTAGEKRAFKFRGQEFDTGQGTDLIINESYLALPENRDIIKQAMGESDLLFQPDILHQAQAKGYEGQARGEAAEWVAATRKYGKEGMTKEARMKRAKDMGFDVDTVFYHGTGNLLDLTEFNPEMTGQGNDQYGSGFYLTSESSTASGYTEHQIQPGVEKIGGQQSPGVLPVYVKLDNPIKVDSTDVRNLDEAIELSEDQVRQMLDDESMNPLGDHFESFWETGPEPWMIDEIAATYTGVSPEAIEVELFDGDSKAFREAMREVTGHDGVEITFQESGEKHIVAWFPDQIRSVHAAFDPDYKDSGNLLAQTQVTTTETIEETGEVVEITERGDMAYTRTQQRTQSLEAMINCLRA